MNENKFSNLENSQNGSANLWPALDKTILWQALNPAADITDLKHSRHTVSVVKVPHPFLKF